MQAGKVRVLAVANEKRVKALPDVPAISETIKGYGATPWYGLLAPAGTPNPVIAQIHAAAVKAVTAPDRAGRGGTIGTTRLLRGFERFQASV